MEKIRTKKVLRVFITMIFEIRSICSESRVVKMCSGKLNWKLHRIHWVHMPFSKSIKPWLFFVRRVLLLFAEAFKRIVTKQNQCVFIVYHFWTTLSSNVWPVYLLCGPDFHQQTLKRKKQPRLWWYWWFYCSFFSILGTLNGNRHECMHTLNIEIVCIIYCSFVRLFAFFSISLSQCIEQIQKWKM